MGGGVVHAVGGVDLRVERGQLVAVAGRSGSGKTTLLSMIGALDRPTAGSVPVDGLTVSELPESELVELPAQALGFIFQAFGLLPILSAAENVEVPLRLIGDGAEAARRARRGAARAWLAWGSAPTIGRTSCPAASSSASPSRGRWPTEPRCCSPTSRPASSTRRPARRSWACSGAWSRSEGVTAIVATHDPALIDLADRVIELRDGVVVGDSAASERSALIRPWHGTCTPVTSNKVSNKGEQGHGRRNSAARSVRRHEHS